MQVDGARRAVASMRPPAKQAENTGFPLPGDLDRRRASMRPPAKQAENVSHGAAAPESAPRFNEAACKTGGKLARRAAARRFNEAACKTGGKPGAMGPLWEGEDGASMRPPAKQAENKRRGDGAPERRRGFNEAACKTGGKRGAARGGAAPPPSLQ